MGKIFNYLGVTNGCITNDLDDEEERKIILLILLMLPIMN